MMDILMLRHTILVLPEILQKLMKPCIW